jgi:putative phosphoribosyl transferase
MTGEKLAKELLRLKQNQTDVEDAIVVAIPRGGVIVGDVKAAQLVVKLDIVVSRKIGAPDDPEVAIGAVMPDGSYFLHEEIVKCLKCVKRVY